MKDTGAEAGKTGTDKMARIVKHLLYGTDASGMKI